MDDVRCVLCASEQGLGAEWLTLNPEVVTATRGPKGWVFGRYQADNEIHVCETCIDHSPALSGLVEHIRGV